MYCGGIYLGLFGKVLPTWRLGPPFSPWVSGLKTGSSPETQQTVMTLYWSNYSQRPVHSSLIAFDYADWAVSLLPAHLFCSQGYHTIRTTSTVPTGSSPLGCYSDLARYYDCCIHLAPGSWAKPPGFYYFSFPITALLSMSLTLWLSLLLSTWACMWPAHELLSHAGALSPAHFLWPWWTVCPLSLWCNILQWIFGPHIHS